MRLLARPKNFAGSLVGEANPKGNPPIGLQAAAAAAAELLIKLETEKGKLDLNDFCEKLLGRLNSQVKGWLAAWYQLEVAGGCRVKASKACMAEAPEPKLLESTNPEEALANDVWLTFVPEEFTGMPQAPWELYMTFMAVGIIPETADVDDTCDNDVMERMLGCVPAATCCMYAGEG